MNAPAIISGGRSLVSGQWCFDAQAPLLVSDPEKFRTLLGLPPRPRGRRGFQMLETGIVPYTILKHVRRRAERTRRELEHLLSGGRRLWLVDQCNLVVNQGLDDLLDVTLSGGTQDTSWFVGLTDGSPTPAAGDTLASHGGWTEVTAYDETNRVAWVDGGVSGQSVSNSGSPAEFTIDTNSTTVGGGHLAGVTSGTSGRLYAVAAFAAGDKTLDDGDSLLVTATFTMAAA